MVYYWTRNNSKNILIIAVTITDVMTDVMTGDDK